MQGWGARHDLTESTNQLTARVNTNGKRGRQDDHIQAYAIRTTPYNHAKCLFDSGASRHMSGNADDFSDLQSRKGIIHITKGLQLPIKGIRTAYLRALLPDDTTKETKLTNVPYSRHLKSTRLLAWSYIRDKGCSL